MGTPIPLLMVALLLGIAIGWRVWLQRRRFGGTGLVLFRSFAPLEVLRDAGLLAPAVSLIALGAGAWWYPLELARTGWIRELGAPGALRAGIVLCCLAVGFIVHAQVHMGRSWRVGIEPDAKPGLVTTGPFAFCRNPIYLGMFLWHAGFTCVVPIWANAALTLLVIAGVTIQVRHEEAYLTRTYGDAYRAYAARTGRFLPGVGRL